MPKLDKIVAYYATSSFIEKRKCFRIEAMQNRMNYARGGALRPCV